MEALPCPCRRNPAMNKLEYTITKSLFDDLPELHAISCVACHTTAKISGINLTREDAIGAWNRMVSQPADVAVLDLTKTIKFREPESPWQQRQLYDYLFDNQYIQENEI